MTEQTERDFVSLASPTMPTAGHGSQPCQGLYHRPAGTQPTVAFMATHYNVDFGEHYLAPYLAAERGYGFLGWNTRFRGNEAYFLLESALVDMGVGLRWLRERGRASTRSCSSATRAVARSCRRTSPRRSSRTSLRPSAGSFPRPCSTSRRLTYYIALNAHPGRPEVLTNWFDPSVTDEVDPISVDPELDLFAEGTRCAVRPGLPRALPGRAAGPQRQDHRVGRTTSCAG